MGEVEIKKGLRERIRQERKELNPPDCIREDLVIALNLMRVVKIVNPGLVLCYMPLPGEPDTRSFLMRLWGNGVKTAVPLCVDDCNLKFFKIDDFDCLQPGKYGILEPIAKLCSEVRVFDNSICVVPGLSFDREGNRLGNGAGYYDRFLSNYSGLKIGVCYDRFLTDHLPKGDGDIPVDIVVTGIKGD